MVIIIIEATSVVATGETWRKLTCEECTRDYYCHLQEEVRATIVKPAGLKSATDMAQEQAASQLEARLYKSVHPIPCPHCGHIQEDMVPIYQERSSRKFGRSAGILIGVGLTLLGIAPAFTASHLDGKPVLGKVGLALLWVLAVGSSAAGFIFHIVDRRKRSLYDPNLEMDRETRIAEGKRKAVSEEEYLRLTTARPVR